MGRIPVISDQTLLFKPERLHPRCRGRESFPGKLSSVSRLRDGIHALFEYWMAQHVRNLARSYRHLTGQELIKGAEGFDDDTLSRRVFDLPDMVVSQGSGKDPFLTYGNGAALETWEMPLEQFVMTPSRFTAETSDREDRAALLRDVERYGFVHDYSGTRVSRTGRRFNISHTTVWVLPDDTGGFSGMAAIIRARKYV